MDYKPVKTLNNTNLPVEPKKINDIMEKPLVIHLKEKNEFNELITVQKEIRDALRDLVNELKYEPPKPKEKPKAILTNKEKKNDGIKNV